MSGCLAAFSSAWRRSASLRATVTEKIAETYTEVLDSARAKGTPLLITVPSTGGGAAGKDRLTRYIREAIGVKI